MDGQRLAQPVYARQLGHGPRQVLAIHCTLAHSGAWRGVAQALDHAATFTAFDMLSHGRSPDWDGQGDVQDRMTEIGERFLTGRMDLVGHSFGATVALRLAVAHPERVQSLTMIEPVFFAVALADAPELLAGHEADAAPFSERLAAGDYETGARLFNRMWSEGQSRWAELPEVTRAAMVRSIRLVPACRPSLYDDLAGLLKPGQLARVTAPALLLRGDRSHPVMAAINDGLARRLPDAQSLVVPGSGHMLPITHPAETAAHLRALFARAAG